MPTAAEYRSQAARCRRLARGFYRPNDPTAELLLEMALEFDAAATAAELAERGKVC